MNFAPRRYCGYCYGTHPLGINDDGSLIICTNCGAGLAPLDRAYDAFVEMINEKFMEAHS